MVKIMKATFVAEKAFKQAYAMPPVGNFAIDVEPPKTPHWDHCREQFASKFDGTVPGFYYSVRPGTGEDVAAFLVKCEGVIGIDEMKTPYSYSLFGRTNKDSILWVQPSVFWLDCGMKRSVLTAFLRCGLNYSREKDNFDEAMFSESFAENRWVRETRAATMRFLYGFTRWRQQIPVVLNLMNRLATLRHGNRLGQEKDSPISCITIPLRDTCKPCNKCRLKRVLKQHGEVKTIAPEQAGKLPLP